MKKSMLLIVVIFTFVICFPTLSARAGELVDGNISLGQDHVKMTWYLVGSGKIADTEVPFAVVRKYYTNVGIKNETVELLMSKFSLDAERASSLYFTEYIYNYSPDHKLFAVGYIRHYDMNGNLIYGTEFDGLSEASKLTWANVEAKGPSGLALVQVRRVEKIPAPKK
ncbi:MAG: hypothetical protein FWH52_03185 [Synergistaceae bacterium]|nr:hypothetical protein [Synergistaceae bacterium]